MKKKWLCCLLATALCGVTLAGCSQSKSESQPADTDVEAESVSETSLSTTSASSVETPEEFEEEEGDENLLSVSSSVVYDRTAADYKIAVVPRMTSLQWFKRMEKGISEFNEDNDSEVVYGGASEGDGQVAYVEGLLSENWDAICVVPYDIEAMTPILEQAREQGVVVITHEASDMDSSAWDFDLEAFDNITYGENFMKQLGEMTDGRGQYIQMVATESTISHNQWCDAARAYQEENYPDMELIARIETQDDIDTSYEKIKELLSLYPDVTAIQGSASQDIIGAAMAVEEMNLSGEVAIVGTSLTLLCKEYVERGTIASFSLWDPAEAGKAMVELAVLALNHEISAKDDTVKLSAEGYKKCVNTDHNGVLYGNARIDVDAAHLKEYNF